MLFDATFWTADACCAPPTRFHAQRNGCPCPSAPVKVILVSQQTIEKVPPPLRDWRMLKSLGSTSLTTGGPSGVMGDLAPSGENKTGHMPAFSARDQSAQSITGTDPYAKDAVVSAVS